MTQIIKSAIKSSLFVFVIVLAMFFVVSDNSFAVNNSNNANSTTTNTTTSFCDTIASKGAELLSKFDSLSAKLAQAWEKRDQTLSTKWQDITKEVTDKRSQADAKRFDDYAKLEARAKTTTQTEAVRVYEDSVNTAISVRRKSYDVARQTFRDGVKSVIEERRNTVNGELNLYRNSITQATEIAQSSCSDAKNAKSVVRQTFKDSLKKAQSVFKAARSDDSKVKDKIKPLIDTRKLSYEVADQAFQSSMQMAKTTILAAFGDNTSN